MSSARYVGRVGALAVALGIGAVIAGVPGVAWADTEGEPDAPGVSAPENPDGSTGDPSDTDVGGGDLGDPGDGDGVDDAGDPGDVVGADDSAGGMQVGSSGGAITSTTPGSAGAKSKKDDDAEPRKKRSTVKQKVFSLPPSPTKTTTQSTATTVAEPGRKARSHAPTLGIASPKDPGPQVKQAASSPVDVAPLTLAAPGLEKPVAARMTAVTKPLAQSPVSPLLPFVTLAPTADGKQPGTTESPLLLGFLAAGREVDKKASIEDESLARTVDSTETSLMTTATNSLTSFQVKATRTSANLDITPPTVSLTAPTNNASVSGTVSLTASASDNVKVTGVQFYVDGAPLGAEDTKSPYSASWNTTTVANGTYAVTARARDAAGNTTVSAPVSITVANPDTTAPTVAVTAPTGPVSGTVSLSATASDNVGVSGVQFLVNGTPVGAEDTTSPYGVSFNTATVANGMYAVTARARDAAGNTTVSAPVSITVANPDTTAPTVVVTAPTGPVSGTVSLGATASDNVGVVGVQFLVNGTPVGAEDTTSPYGVSFNTATVANGMYAVTARARDAAGNVTTSAPVSVTVANSDTTAPTVSLTGLANGATVSGAVPLTANASDNVGVAGVQFLVNGIPVGAEDTNALDGYSTSWNTATVANGTYTVTVRARDAAGNATLSTPVTITVANGDVTAPSVTLTGPANGASVSGPVSLSANASDNVAVVGVQFLVNGTPVGAEDTNALDGYSASWNTATVANGTYTLTARARDAAGNITTSAPVTVTVANSDVTAPTVSLTGLFNGASVSGPVSLSANASDNVGVVGVQFFVDGVPLNGEDAIAPYSTSWNTTTIANGMHTVTATARDSAGNITTSTPVTVTVANGDVTAPLATFYGPANGASVSGPVSLSAWVSDNVGVAGVQFLVDGMPIGAEDTTLPYGPMSFDSTTVADGFHTLSVRARDAAGNTTISMPVSVNVVNGTTPATYVVNPVTVGTGPSGVVVANGYTYVINYDSSNVTVMNTATNQFVGNIAVGSGPLSVAASEEGKRVYVSNSLDNSVSVIDATTNTVVDTIRIDVPRGYNADNPEWGPVSYDNKVTELAVNSQGTRLYVNATDGSIRVIDTDPNSVNYKKVIRIAYLGRFNDLKVSPDGTRLYSTPGVGLTVIDTATMMPVSVQVGPVWDHNAMQAAFTDSTGNIAVSPDGKRVYVAYSATTVARGTGGHTSGSFITDAQGVSWLITGGMGGVSVIDTDPASATYNKEIARILVPGWAQDLVVSGDRLYVTEWDDMSVTVIDTKTNAIVGSFTTDQTRSGRSLWVYGYYEWWDVWDSLFSVAAFSRYITATPDGSVYVTDYGNGTMYVVTPGSPLV